MTIAMRNVKRMTAQDFCAVVDSYAHVYDAVDAGVGVTHSFPPRGDLEHTWKKIVRARELENDLVVVSARATEQDKRAVEAFYANIYA